MLVHFHILRHLKAQHTEPVVDAHTTPCNTERSCVCNDTRARMYWCWHTVPSSNLWAEQNHNARALFMYIKVNEDVSHKESAFRGPFCEAHTRLPFSISHQ